MAKGNDSPYALMPEDEVVIRNMDFLRFGRADITPLIGHYGPNYLFLRNDYNRSSFLFGGDYYITDSGCSNMQDHGPNYPLQPNNKAKPPHIIWTCGG